MRKLLLSLALVGCFTLGVAGPAFANDPHSPANPTGNPTGPPSQTCQNFGPDGGPQYPGNSSGSPGSPFDEALPGNGGTKYSGNSQYDVACFQHNSHL
jgi:hypothetical protein